MSSVATHGTVQYCMIYGNCSILVVKRVSNCYYRYSMGNDGDNIRTSRVALNEKELELLKTVKEEMGFENEAHGLVLHLLLKEKLAELRD